MASASTDRVGRSARVLLTATAFSVGVLDTYSYKQAGFGGQGAWDDLLAGKGVAPEQYRVGIVWLAHGMVVYLHTSLPVALGLLDGVGALVALLLLFAVLQRTRVYAEASPMARWFGVATFVLLVEWALAWRFWVQKPETLPPAGLVAAMLWIWQAPASASPTSQTRDVGRPHLWLIGTALVLLSVALATVRADIACLLSVGIFLYRFVRPDAELALPRPAALLVSAVSTLLAGGLQLYLMRVVFPQASYGNVKLWQLLPNLIHVTRWPPFVLFVLPFVWMTVRVARRRFAKDDAGVAFLVGTMVFAALWLTIGKIDEVRIVLPLVLALCPLAAEMAMLEAES